MNGMPGVGAAMLAKLRRAASAEPPVTCRALVFRQTKAEAGFECSLYIVRRSVIGPMNDNMHVRRCCRGGVSIKILSLGGR